ncbi:coiled-coil domain-containing protein 13 [Elysia marginata]|uniref:Coiled-coil domain-containing protein 13 n=1 Tax=Elysia marginata TaxID=1093978 RepID=A0AAV4HD71_9GAST|nr:coiled-coil domain-containing protein 13 [Elysia marginata]
METKELRDQFQELQAQQQKKLMERRRKKELAAKNENKNNDASQNLAGKFGVNDDMNLKLSDPASKGYGYLSEELVDHLNDQIRLSDPASKGYGYLSEELVDHLNDQIREMKDENGRLYKLLSERDFEIRQLKKKSEETKAANPLLNEAVTNETAATKIIELSRKVRELTAEKESERNKCRQLQKKIHDLQAQSQAASMSEPPSNMGSMISLRSQVSDNRNSEDSAGVDVKALQDRLKQTEARCTDFRNQCQSLRQELKVANKVLSQEIGENVNIQSLLNETSNWRGRAQQIIALQQKVDELKVQLDSSEVGSVSGQPEKGSSGRRRQEERYRDELKRLERERKEAQESTVAKLKGLEEENKGLRDKIDAAKVRNKVLSNDIKQQKAQVETLLKKSRNDDEFIDALMKQQGQLKKLLDDTSSQQSQQTMAAHLQLQQMSMKSQQDSNVVEQLKAIAAQKEAQVKMLEMELQSLRGQAARKLPAGPAPAYLDSREQSTVLNSGGDLEVNVTVDDITLSGQSEGRTILSRNESQSAMSMTQLSSSRSQSRASSATVVLNSQRPDHQELSELRYRCEEVEIMCRATEVERDKLSELVQVLQLRLAEETDKLNEANSQVQTLRRATVELEKKLAKQALDGMSVIRNQQTVFIVFNVDMPF